MIHETLYQNNNNDNNSKNKQKNTSSNFHKPYSSWEQPLLPVLSAPEYSRAFHVPICYASRHCDCCTGPVPRASLWADTGKDSAVAIHPTILVHGSSAQRARFPFIRFLHCPSLATPTVAGQAVSGKYPTPLPCDSQGATPAPEGEESGFSRAPSACIHCSPSGVRRSL